MMERCFCNIMETICFIWKFGKHILKAMLYYYSRLWTIHCFFSSCWREKLNLQIMKDVTCYQQNDQHAMLLPVAKGNFNLICLKENTFYHMQVPVLIGLNVIM